MKGLRLYLAPFAPDQAGAAAVLCELGGLVVIVDAGGCAGNICGFDEPRWFSRRSAVFSAGLRDMDAILGRDDRLIAKICDASAKLKKNFIALIGTPVPAVIGTDYRALCRILTSKTGLPAFYVDTDGTRLYDDGASRTWLALTRTFARQGKKAEDRVGVLGASPMDFGNIDMQAALKEQSARMGGARLLPYGMGAGFEDVLQMACVRENLVIAPSGLAAARFLQKEFAIPYKACCVPELIPGLEQILRECKKRSVRNILIVHQQLLAGSLREQLRRFLPPGTVIRTGTFFKMDRDCMESGDLKISSEEEWIHVLAEGGWDLLIGDKLLFDVPAGDIPFLPLPHFAVSGGI